MALKNKNLGITSSLVHNNLFPIKNIEISQLRDYKEINFHKVNTLINNIDKTVQILMFNQKYI